MAFLHHRHDHHHLHLPLLLLFLVSSPLFCFYVGTLQISSEAELKGRGRLVYDDESGLDLHQTERNTSMDRSVKERDDNNKNSTTQTSVSKGADLHNQKERNDDAHKSSTKKPASLGNKTVADVNKTGSLGYLPPPPPPPPSEKGNQTDKGSLKNSTDVTSLDPDSDENDPDSEENVVEAKGTGNSTKADEKDPEAKEDGLDSEDDSSDTKENEFDSEHDGPEEKENSLESDENDPGKKENVPESKGNDSESKENDQNSDSPAISCGESHCEIPDMLITACLRTPGDGMHMLALSITYEGDSIKSKDGEITVKVSAPELLVADLSEVTIKEQSSKTIEFRVNPKLEVSEVNIKELKLMTINVSSPNGSECKIWLPIGYLQNIAQKDFQHFFPSSTYAAFATSPMVSATLVFFVVALTSIVGWLCHKFCGRKKNVDTLRYQQLEMIESETPKERINETLDGWDESWDDDWEDAEAVKSSSRMSQSLSSRGLAARRGNKDGWDNDWDD